MGFGNSVFASMRSPHICSFPILDRQPYGLQISPEPLLPLKVLMSPCTFMVLMANGTASSSMSPHFTQTESQHPPYDLPDPGPHSLSELIFSCCSPSSLLCNQNPLLDVSQSSQAFVLAVPSAQNAIPSAWKVFPPNMSLSNFPKIGIARKKYRMPDYI